MRGRKIERKDDADLVGIRRGLCGSDADGRVWTVPGGRALPRPAGRLLEPVHLMSMEWKERDPDNGRDFDAFVEVAAPALFPESPIDSKVMEELREKWNSRNWEVEFKDLKFETSPPEADDPGWEGDEASVRIVDGQVRYYGKEMFDTNEWKVESFKDKPGEFVLRKLDGRWRVVGARVIGDGDSWSVE